VVFAVCTISVADLSSTPFDFDPDEPQPARRTADNARIAARRTDTI
jgi:hypothetical protein